jgi:two-component system response regulator PilR (NtrC family)
VAGKQERRGSPGLGRVLVVDDEDDIRELLDMTLSRMGLDADCAENVAQARRLLSENAYQLCLTDMRLPDGDGLELVRFIGEHCRDLPVAVITAHGSMENAVSALKAGAFDYVPKPVSLEQLRALVKSVLNLPSKETAKGEATGRTLLGESQAIRQARAMIEKVARSQAPVYISGESGSGKELAARLIHEQGARHSQAFIAVNCGAIPESLMESEFFGYKKGAFTGADAERDGFFQAAHGGTLFLDEVADLPLTMQVKLLRAIQEKRVRKVGASAEDPVDVRIISATHQNLKELVAAARFRQDLFYRLDVIELKMPSLRECREDIPILADSILARLARESGMPMPHLTGGALKALGEYPFPGNVRELENILERVMALIGGSNISVDDLHLAPLVEPDGTSPSTPEGGASLQDHLDRVEKQAILEALQKTRFNRTAAAKLLGVTFRSLRYRMERLGLNE